MAHLNAQRTALKSFERRAAFFVCAPISLRARRTLRRDFCSERRCAFSSRRVSRSRSDNFVLYKSEFIGHTLPRTFHLKSGHSRGDSNGIVCMTKGAAISKPYPRDVKILFLSRALRLFSFGIVSVVLVMYLKQVGLSGSEIGLLFTMTLIGDALMSLLITSVADSMGRRTMLKVSGLLVLFAGLVFSLGQHNLFLLTLASVVGVISPGGNDIGPFLPIEQASLAQLVSDKQRTKVMSFYSLTGSLSVATGSLIGGAFCRHLQATGMQPLLSYRLLIMMYGFFGLALSGVACFLSPKVELPHLPATEALVVDPVPSKPKKKSSSGPSGPFKPVRSLFKKIRRRAKKMDFGLKHSWPVVLRLGLLFSIDAFGAAFVLQSFIADFFHQKFDANPAELGRILFGANVLGGASALLAPIMARRIGLVRTMVFTHLPSSIFLLLVPLMPSLNLAVLMLLLRFSISQMDVPTRSSYTVAVCDPRERTAAAGFTNICRTLGASLSPFFAGVLFSNSKALLGVPFFLGAFFMIVYDLLLLWQFKSVRPPEEIARALKQEKGKEAKI